MVEEQKVKLRCSVEDVHDQQLYEEVIGGRKSGHIIAKVFPTKWNNEKLNENEAADWNTPN